VKALVAILVFLDCLVNLLLLGSFNETLSSRAHRMRIKPQPCWFWLADAIDFLLFWEPDHCRDQYEREKKAGGAWKALVT
jgi:hypothetical protein